MFAFFQKCFKITFLASNKLIAVMSMLTFLVFWLFIGSSLRTEISISLFGFVTLPVFYVGYELAVEKTKQTGLGSALPCGIINTVANVVSTVLVFSLTPIIAV